MTTLSGITLRTRKEIITPFVERTSHQGFTYGLSHAGYDVRIRECLILKPHEFRLASTIEHFNMPLDLVAKVHDKSTWARRGLSLFNTVIEPGWRGYLTLELCNKSDMELWIDAGMPIAQILFDKLDQPAVGYTGKYQDQGACPVSAIF